MVHDEYDVEKYDLVQIIEDHYPEIESIHPAANLFPMLNNATFKELADDVRQKGLQAAIVVTPDRRLLDGRNRLLACYVVGQDIRVENADPVDPISWCISRNIKRRDLTQSQRAMIADKARALYDAQAKERQGTRTDLKPDIVAILPPSTPRQPSKARDRAGAAIGVSGKYTDMARDIRIFGGDAAVKDVANGKVTLPKAHQKVAAAVKAAKAVAAPPADARLTKPVVTPGGELKMIPAAHKPQFNATNGNVEWASWTWNPISGCLHGCEFCYARAITNSDQTKANYPFNFEPAFYRYRLAAPVNTKKPASSNPCDGRVFVGSMADLFGKWVPDEWIAEVFDACMAAPDWEYLFLTKWPKRYSMLATLPNAWFGASVIQQSDVRRVESNMRAFETSGVKWISLEPMLEPIRFDDLSWCDLMVLGAQTGTRQPTGYVPEKAPDFDWVVDVVNQCRDAGVPYYLKPNLATSPGMILPKQSPLRRANLNGLSAKRVYRSTAAP